MLSIKNINAILFLVIFTLIAPVGYIVGLVSHPADIQIPALKNAVLPVIAAFSPVENNQNNAQQLQPLEQSIQVEQSNSPVTNPFESGKIINIAQNSKQEKSRFTTIDLESFRNSVDASVNSNIDNPLSDNPMGEVSIQVMGENPDADLDLGMVKHKPKVISLADNKDALDTNADKKQKPIDENTDLYAQRRTPLKNAPVTGYGQKTEFGILPIQPTGQPPLYRVYGNNKQSVTGKKSVGIIIGGLGIDDKITTQAIKTLPPEVTLGFVPYSNNLQNYINLARRYGHETILEIPMESYDYPRPDVGDKVLLTSQDNQTYRNHLKWLLGRATGYSGIMNYLGNKYIVSKNVNPLLNDVKQSGLYFVENKTSQAGLLRSEAIKNTVPYAMSSDIIDTELSPLSIMQKMQDLHTSTGDNPVVMTGYASSVTLNIVKQNIILMENNGVNLMPVSGLVQ